MTQLIKTRSFRYSSSGLPLLNIDIGFSAFLATGPAIEVITKILGRGGPPRRGGFRGGPPPPVAAPAIIHALEPREISIIKNKLRGAKVSYTLC